MNATLSLRRTIRISNGSPALSEGPSRSTITVAAGRAAAMFGGTIESIMGELPAGAPRRVTGVVGWHRIAAMIERKDTDGIRVLKLAHGKVSAMDIELGEALTREIADAAAAPIKAVIVTGSGSAFSAGVDLFRVVNDGPEYGRRFLPVLDEFLRAALTFPKPMVAAINGHAIAGGCILAAACDHRIMVEGNGRIGIPELAVGVPFPALPLQIMAARLADGPLRDLVFTGRTVQVDEAKAIGLIDEKCPAGMLLDRAIEVAQQAGVDSRRRLCADERGVLHADPATRRLTSPISTRASSRPGCSRTPTTRSARIWKRRSKSSSSLARGIRHEAPYFSQTQSRIDNPSARDIALAEIARGPQPIDLRLEDQVCAAGRGGNVEEQRRAALDLAIEDEVAIRPHLRLNRALVSIRMVDPCHELQHLTVDRHHRQ